MLRQVASRSGTGAGISEQNQLERIIKYSWSTEQVNYEGLRVNFDVTTTRERADTESNYTGWCMLRASLHEPILSMQIESDQAGGAKLVAGILLNSPGEVNGSDCSVGFSQLANLFDLSPLVKLATLE
jgi:hypothetical protein